MHLDAAPNPTSATRSHPCSLELGNARNARSSRVYTKFERVEDAKRNWNNWNTWHARAHTHTHLHQICTKLHHDLAKSRDSWWSVCCSLSRFYPEIIEIQRHMFHQHNHYKREHCILFELHVTIPHTSRGTIHFKLSNPFNKYENKARVCFGVPRTIWIVTRTSKSLWVMVASSNQSSFAVFFLWISFPEVILFLPLSPFYFDAFGSQCFSIIEHPPSGGIKKQSTVEYLSRLPLDSRW